MKIKYILSHFDISQLFPQRLSAQQNDGVNLSSQTYNESTCFMFSGECVRSFCMWLFYYCKESSENTELVYRYHLCYNL